MMTVKCSVVKVKNGNTGGRDYSIVEGYSPEIGLFKCFTSREAGKQAEACIDFADNTYMQLEAYTDYDYKVNVRVVGFTIE